MPILLAIIICFAARLQERGTKQKKESLVLFLFVVVGRGGSLV